MSRITSKGQVTIPKNIRQVLGVKPGDQIEYEQKSLMFHAFVRLVCRLITLLTLS